VGVAERPVSQCGSCIDLVTLLSSTNIFTFEVQQATGLTFCPDFTLTVVSPQFNDLTRIKRHRMINTLLKEEFDDKGLHALSLQLKTPAEWEQDIIAAEAKMVKQ
jgi:stress-induced morphogen